MDDEPDLCEVLARMLGQFGHRVVTTPEGGTALQRYAAALQNGDRFDLVILDLTVKGGMGGLETLKRLLELDPRAVVLASSGYANDRILADHRLHGFKSVLRKPYGVDELQRALAETLGAPPAA